jgi:hypothetical protein
VLGNGLTMEGGHGGLEVLGGDGASHGEAWRRLGGGLAKAGARR